MRYNKWLKTWLEYYVKPIAKIRTYEKYAQIVRVHIIPELGEKEINEIDAVTLQKYTVMLSMYGNSKNNTGLSSATVNNIISVLQKSLKTALIVGVTQNQYADSIKRPKLVEKKVECFSVEEQKQIESYIYGKNKVKYYGIILCLYTGLRIGELLALEWKNIDFAKQIISIENSCHFGKTQNGKYEKIIDTPKTENSKRLIPYPKQLNSLLNEMKKASHNDLFVSNKGKPISTRSYQRTLELILKKLGISHKGFHALRHTFATRAIACGMDVKTLSEILGHKNTTITLNRYVHSLLPHKMEMMNKLGKMLSSE